ncbi:hypothetical protein FACS1894130_02920 [Spirochaetia bacterium]|nr:hypothetical protein FACS1894130_02920 [Spirochaetia bacterium]
MVLSIVKDKVWLFLLIFSGTVLFSQENNDLLIKYKLGTKLNYIIENEEAPYEIYDDHIDGLIWNEYVFIKKIDNFEMYYVYKFVDKKLYETDFVLKNDLSIIDQYNEIFDKIFEYYKNKYGYSETFTQNIGSVENYKAIWEIDDGFITLNIDRPVNNNIANLKLWIIYSEE